MRRRSRLGQVVAVAIAAVALSGCAKHGPSTPLTTAAIASPELDAKMADAIRFRSEFGLRKDLEYVAAVAADPNAVMDFGVPLLPEEAREIERRGSDAEKIVPIVRTYVSAFPSEFAGVYIDQANGGRVTVLFTDHLAEHAAGLREVLAGTGVVLLRQVRYSEAALTAVQDRIDADSDWFGTIPAMLQSVGLDTIGNRIDVSVSSKNAAIEGLVIAHFGVEAAMVNVSSDGTGAAFLPFATIKGKVVTAAGKAPGINDYMVTARGDGPGRCAGDVDEVAHGVSAVGAFEIACATGRWTIVIQDLPAGAADWVDLGKQEVIIPDGGVVRLLITLDPPTH